ncbi:MAG: immunoglobulin domain-containing protein, partial [Verrucomicrobiota bacterium]
VSPGFAADQTVFIGTSFYGVWKTTDGGNSWARVSSGLAILDVRTLAVSPTYATDRTVFAGTALGGIFKTVNGGETWMRIDGGVTTANIKALAVSPNFATDGHIFAATEGQGIFASRDGGSNWTARNSGLTDGWLNSLVISPNYTQDRTLFAFSWDRVFKSVNQGYLWTEISSGTITAIHTLAISPTYASDRTLFIATGQSEPGRAIWKSTDGGSSWLPIAGDSNWWDVQILAVSPSFQTDQTLFAFHNAGGPGPSVRRSTDGGATWAPVYPVPFFVHGSYAALAVSPAYTEDRTVYASSDRWGMAKSTDGGDTWLEANGGLTERGNASHGVTISGGAHSNVIGGDSPGKRNVISHNAGWGVGITDVGTTNNLVIGNYIGTDGTGAAPLGNDMGILIGDAGYNRIGGDRPEHRNVISGNRFTDVMIGGEGAGYNVVSANFVGTDASGSGTFHGATAYGVRIENGAKNNVVGGTSAGERNAIVNGIYLVYGGTSSNKIVGNFIGTDATGTIPLGGDGIEISWGSQHVTVERNVISGLVGNGVDLSGQGTMFNTVRANYIGTDVTGTKPLGNQGFGINIWGGASANLIGGDAPGDGNVISANGSYGIQIHGTGSVSNRVSGNRIGTDPSGTIALGNASGGVYIVDGAQHNRVGGTNSGQGNLVAFNKGDGVQVSGANTIGNSISGNSIHSNGRQAIKLLDGGNNNLGAPVIQPASSNSVAGVTRPAYIVEIFSDADYEGQHFEGSVIAEASGQFNFSKPGGFTGPRVAVTVTDEAANTSEFSNHVLPVELPIITRQPESGSYKLGSNVILSVTAVGTGPLAYQWHKDGVNLAESGRITGTRSSTLTITGFQASDAGEYRVVVSSAAGSVTSLPAVLTVKVLEIEMLAGVWVMGQVGQTYDIEASWSLDVGPWTKVVTVKLTQERQLWIDMDSLGRPKRFYRPIPVP